MERLTLPFAEIEDSNWHLDSASPDVSLNLAQSISGRCGSGIKFHHVVTHGRMLEMTVDVVLSGDPMREGLFGQIAKLYSKYTTISQVLLYFEGNPAKAFNRAGRESTAEVLLCTGDIYMKEDDMIKMVSQLLSTKADVVFIVPPRLENEKRILFVDAAFAVKKQTLMENPMPEEPDFAEEVLWFNTKKDVLKFRPYFGIHYHLHKHEFNRILKLRLTRYYERARAKNRGRFIRSLAVSKIFLESVRQYLSEQFMPSPEEMLRRLSKSKTDSPNSKDTFKA